MALPFEGIYYLFIYHLHKSWCYGTGLDWPAQEYISGPERTPIEQSTKVGYPHKHN